LDGLSDRRRMRRIDADRPMTDEWLVRESMWFFDFLLAASLAVCAGRRSWCSSRVGRWSDVLRASQTRERVDPVP